MIRKTVGKRNGLVAFAIAFLAPAIFWAELLAQGSGELNGTGVAPGDTKPASESRTAAGEDRDGEWLRIGDHLKITFFESLDVPVAAAATEGGKSNHTIHTFYERIDLTGEYRVGLSGVITLPLLGAIVTAGRPPEDVKADLADAFQQVASRPAEVHISILERAPVYVVGPVKTPGAYQFVPGMIVLHALALAGGLDRNEVQAMQVVGMMREAERNERARDRLKRLLARHARLTAELSDEPWLIPSKRLIELAGDEEARTIMAAETKLGQQTEMARYNKVAGLKAAAETIKSEVKILKNQVADVNAQINHRDQRLVKRKQQHERGILNEEGMFKAQAALDDARIRRRELEASTLRASQKLNETKQSITQIDLTHRSQREQEIAQVEAGIAEAERTVATSESVADVMGQSMDRLASGSSSNRAMYEVVRRGSGGTMRIEATDTFNLEPGDVLRISLEPQLRK